MLLPAFAFGASALVSSGFSVCFTLNCFKQSKNEGGHHKMFQLADAQTGVLRDPLSILEATALAKQQFNGEPTVKSVEEIKDVDGHHEYRESLLPAVAVTFKRPTLTTVYVATELSIVTKYRNDKWRIFDFLWMLHTMDYQSRDNIGNWLLRAFSVFGLFTICSGFTLFFVSFRRLKKRKYFDL
jgi:hypothetical protein